MLASFWTNFSRTWPEDVLNVVLVEALGMRSIMSG